MNKCPSVLMKGNEAVVHGALLAGCHSYFGYPITPASEIAEASAELFPKLGRVFVQAECETAAINMVLGASAAGVRVMTASSGPGISLKQEGISYLAGSELPAVIVNISRSGPGLGNIGPEQSDYNQLVKTGGHGNCRCLVLAPDSAQEMCDLTMLAFELADKYRNPVYVMADGVIGQMIEAVTLPAPSPVRSAPDWALQGNHETRGNVVTSLYLDHDTLEEKNWALQRKYDQICKVEQRCETFMTEDAEIVLVGFGIVGRIIRSAVRTLRQRGVKAGMFRPISLFPFPVNTVAALAKSAKQMLCVELNGGQMIHDLQLAAKCSLPIHGFFRMGGNLPSAQDIVDETIKIMSNQPVGA